MSKLIIVRHGQSMANLVNKFAGQQCDAELSPLGHKQAEKTAEYIVENYKVDAVYASDLKRAYATAEHIAKKFNLPVITEKSMREIFAGKWEGVTYDELKTKYAEEYAVWVHDIGNSICVDGESTKELYERVLKGVHKIAEENPDKTVVIVTHATPIRSMQAQWQGVGLEGMKDIEWVSNASVTVAEYKKGKFKLIDLGYDKHLADMKTVLPKNT